MESRPFEPIKKDDPNIGAQCRLCGSPLLIGQKPSLVVDAEAYLDPDMAESRERLLLGRAHNAQASLVHWSCVVAFGLPRVSES
jgi:hypothetical protein